MVAYVCTNVFEALGNVFLVSLELSYIINKKCSEYNQQSNIKIEFSMEQAAGFVAIHVNKIDFYKMISNLIDNAVEALKYKLDGIVKIRLLVNTTDIIISIEYNACDMPVDIQNSFNQDVMSNQSKLVGFGIVLVQLMDVVRDCNGTCNVYASHEFGTDITIYLPKCKTPDWVCSEIRLIANDIVVVAIDSLIYEAWHTQLTKLLEKIPLLQIKHFLHIQDVIYYINHLLDREKENILLLTTHDYILNQVELKRVILLSNHYEISEQVQILNLGIKLLPCELISSATLYIDKQILKWSRVVDMVWVEDQRWFIDSLVEQFYKHLKVDKYYDPISFMENIHQYPLDTLIILDTYYIAADGTPYIEDGYFLARKLHEIGYTKLILFSGEQPRVSTVPEYLTVVLKNSRTNQQSLDKF